MPLQDEEEPSDSEDADLADDEDFRRRYSLRNRSSVQRYSPRAGQAGAFAVGSKRRRSIVDQVQLTCAICGMQLSGAPPPQRRSLHEAWRCFPG